MVIHVHKVKATLTDHAVDIERYEAQTMMMTCTDAATIRWQHIVSDHDIININVVDLWNSAAPWIMMVYKEVDLMQYIEREAAGLHINTHIYTDMQ